MAPHSPSVNRRGSWSSVAESVSSGSVLRGERRAGRGECGEGGEGGEEESGRSEPATSLMPGSAPPPPHQSEQSQW